MSDVNDMPTDQELFQQALIALEIECKGYNDKVVRNQSLIAALRERLVQPAQQEPTDEQIDAAVKAWFENTTVAGQRPFAKRMRAAMEAAHGISDL